MPSLFASHTALPALLAATLLFSITDAHFSPFTRSMYGVGGTRQGTDWQYSAGGPLGGDPVVPIGPGWTTQDSWWFRGPEFRALAPPAGEVTELPAGQTIMLELACHVAWTSFGWRTTVPGSPLDGCPGGTAGVYHANLDPNSYTLDPTKIAGCALAIANVDDIEAVTWDNLAIFSVQPTCVVNKETYFDVPAMMPPCTGAKCICGWFWLAETGQANFYMTAFDCNVTGSSPRATAIAPPQDAVFCAPGNSTCVPTAGSKRPLYAYNEPTNVVYPGDQSTFNDNRPGYHASWSFNNGAQNDIFLPAVVVSSSSSASSSVAVTSSFHAAVSSSSSAVMSSSHSTSVVLIATSTIAPSSSSIHSATTSSVNLASANLSRASALRASQRSSVSARSVLLNPKAVVAAAKTSVTATATATAAPKARRVLVLDEESLAQVGGEGCVTPECAEAGMCGMDVPALFTVEDVLEVQDREGMNETKRVVVGQAKEGEAARWVV